MAFGLVAGATCAAAYALARFRLSSAMNLLAVIFLCFAFGVFFLNNFPVWADNLNNITMYASRGGLAPVIGLVVVFFLSIFTGITSCFMRKEVRRNEA